MTQELHYTSVPRGLKAGSAGFCTVAHTPNLPGPLLERLEALSGYQQVFPPHDARSALNPVAVSHLRVAAGGRAYAVLSRVGFAGLDYSARSNKYAHHLVLDPDERPSAGPAWLASQPGVLQRSWEGEPRLLPSGRPLPQGDRPPAIARAWQAQAGDAGWAGVLAEAFLADPRKPAYLLFDPGMDLLPLFAEAIALLPPDRRWDVEFSTYFTQLPQGTLCSWRGVLAGSPEAKNVHRVPGALVLDLRRPLGNAKGGDLVHLARTGTLPEQIVTGPRSDQEIAQVEPIESSAPSSPRLPSPPRSRSGVPPELSEAGPLPPRAPIVRSVRDLEGFGNPDERTGLPWGRIAAGLAASLLIALGAGWWTGMLNGVALPGLKIDAARQIIAETSQEASKKKAEDDAKKQQEEDQKKAEQARLAKEEKEAKTKRTEADKKAITAKQNPLKNETPKPHQLAVPKKREAPQPPPQPPQVLVKFIDLPDTATRVLGNTAENKTNSFTLPGPIKVPLRLYHKYIDSDRAQKNAVEEKAKGEEALSLEARVGNPLIVSIPSKSNTIDTLDVATFSFTQNKITFSWGPAGLQPLSRDRTILVRNAVLEATLNDGTTWYVLLRSPEIDKKRISLRRDPSVEIPPRGNLETTQKWIDAQKMEECDWDLVIMNWRIESGKDKKHADFARMEKKASSSRLIQSIIPDVLDFELILAREKLAARFIHNANPTSKESEQKKERERLDSAIKQITEDLRIIKDKLHREKRDGAKKAYEADIAKGIKQLETATTNRDDALKLLSLYEQYLHSDTAFLDVTIGLRLSNGKVIEIAQIGKPIPPIAVGPKKP